MKGAFSFGPFHLFPGQRILRKGDAVVPLGSRAFDMLVALVEDEKVRTTSDLRAIAWPGLVVEDSNVRVQVANLRRALGCGRDGARYIANVAGRGYCFVEPVSRIDALDASVRAPNESDPSREPQPVNRTMGPSGALSSFPPPLEDVIGRERCIPELTQVTRERRLVTVVGAAGAGKTTLAILVAHATSVSDRSMAFVDLSTVDGEDMAAEALGAAVGYFPSGGSFLPGLLEVLSTGKMMIVLDNCEHVLDAVASLCIQILEKTSSVSFLNTSREALRIKDEFVYLLRPLAFPTEEGRLTTAQAMTWPAIQLFMERAWEGGARGALMDEEAPAVAELCRRLDGNPHAIGLVASRVGAYGIQGVSDLLENQVAWSWQGRRDAIPRHQTVEALIGWSHRLLPERDRLVLHRLSVFSGWFTMEAAVAVTSDDAIDAPQVGEAIGDLVDKSLVAVSQHCQGTRLRLLEATRAYAASRLAKTGATGDFARRHALYYADELRRLADGRLRPRHESARHGVPEISNIREALEWASSEARDPALSAEISCLAAPLFLERGLIRECKRTCERAMRDLPPRFRSTRIELGLLDSAAITYYSGGDYEGALKQVVQRGFEVAQQLGDRPSAFQFLTGLHLAMMANGEFQDSLSVCEQYASMADEEGAATERIIGGWMTCSSKHYAGDQLGADASHRASAELVSRNELRPLHYFEMKQRIIASIGLARAQWALGRPRLALHTAMAAIDDGRRHPDSFYMCVTLCFHILLGAGHCDHAKELIDELENVATDYKVAVRRQVVDVLRGQLLLQQGNSPAAIDRLQACLAMLPPPKMSVVRTDALQSLAEAQRRSGDVANALIAIDEALDLARKTFGIFNLADLLRTKAEVMMCLPNAPRDEAARVLAQAVDMAQKQGTLGWELRIALTQAQTLASEGRESEARRTLKPVYSRFTDGFETCDLKAAAQALRAT